MNPLFSPFQPGDEPLDRDIVEQALASLVKLRKTIEESARALVFLMVVSYLAYALKGSVWAHVSFGAACLCYVGIVFGLGRWAKRRVEYLSPLSHSLAAEAAHCLVGSKHASEYRRLVQAQGRDITLGEYQALRSYVLGR